jgi:hypothetical protein
MIPVIAYPRTPHLEGSRLQSGDGCIPQVSFSEIAGLPLVLEEKLDGANCAFSFDEKGQLLLQKRGRVLGEDPNDAHFFSLLNPWVTSHADDFRARFADRYIVYGEWLYPKHTMFYNCLPHYFIEFDVFDRREGVFLDTSRRRTLLEGLPIYSAPLLKCGTIRIAEEVIRLIGPSRFIDDSAGDVFRCLCVDRGIDPDTELSRSDLSGVMEGLYVKYEEGGIVKGRYKFVRPSFFQTVLASGRRTTGWHTRPVLPNQLIAGTNIITGL